jgi:hypothetical protein
VLVKGFAMPGSESSHRSSPRLMKVSWFSVNGRIGVWAQAATATFCDA